MVWPHPRDVILYARSSYFYNNVIIIHEVFHVYLNKFENTVYNLFLNIFGNN